MKKKALLLDCCAYIVVPLVLWGFTLNKLGIISVLSTIAIGTIYTFINKTKNHRYNVFGISTTSVILVAMLLRIVAQDGYSVFVNEMYLFVGISILLVISILIGKNIAKQAFVDVYKIFGYSVYNTYNIIKKYELNNHFYKITSLFILHFLSMAFIKMYTIVKYGPENYKALQVVLVFSCSLFMVGEFVVLSNFYVKVKKIKTLKNVKKKIDPRIICFSEYKNLR